MKTLAESILDVDKNENLKDGLTIRDVYGLFSNNRSYHFCYKDFGRYQFHNLLNYDRVMNLYKHPLTKDDTDVSGEFSKFWALWMGIIMDAPLPPSRANDKKWCKNFKEMLTPWITRLDMEMWEKIKISYEYSSDKKNLTISFSLTGSKQYYKSSIYDLELIFTKK